MFDNNSRKAAPFKAQVEGSRTETFDVAKGNKKSRQQQSVRQSSTITIVHKQQKISFLRGP